MIEGECLRGIAKVVMVVTTLLGLTACATTQRAEYARHLQVCDVAETNGVMSTAVDACESALAIANGRGYADDEVANLSLRVARLYRESGRFVEAETLARQAMQLASSDALTTECGRLEIALSLSGQQRWGEAAALLVAVDTSTAGLTAADLKRLSRTAMVVAGRLSDDERETYQAGLAAVANSESNNASLATRPER